MYRKIDDFIVDWKAEEEFTIRYIQELLGHNISKTTEIYTHVSKEAIDKISNPIDDFFEKD